MALTAETLVRTVVTEDLRAAAVFDDLGIDYYCQGDQTLGEACHGLELTFDDVAERIERLSDGPSERPPRFDTWDPHVLAEYIVREHHEYVRAVLPTLIELTRSIAVQHGDAHPEYHEVAFLIGGVAHELRTHQLKEERILFPYIADLARRDRSEASPFGSVENPIRMMEREHESASRAMARIRVVLSDYVPPADATVACRVCCDALREFERDLHRHMHLENNILFPKTRALEQAGS